MGALRQVYKHNLHHDLADARAGHVQMLSLEGRTRSGLLIQTQYTENLLPITFRVWRRYD